MISYPHPDVDKVMSLKVKFAIGKFMLDSINMGDIVLMKLL